MLATSDEEHQAVTKRAEQGQQGNAPADGVDQFVGIAARDIDSLNARQTAILAVAFDAGQCRCV